MKEMEKLHIFNRAYAFLKWLFNHTGKFPKSHRFSVAVKLENTILELIELITTANMRRNKLDFLVRADEKLLYLKILSRLSYELQFINVKSYEYAAKELVEMGRMMGSWIKQQQAS